MERDRFTDQQWDALAAGPLGAASLVVAADQAGVISMLKEMRGAQKALKAARRDGDYPPVVHDVLDHLDKDSQRITEGSASSDDDPARAARSRLAAAAAATGPLSAEEHDAYVRCVVAIARSVAEAVKEKGSSTAVTDAEAGAIREIEETLRAR